MANIVRTVVINFAHVKRDTLLVIERRALELEGIVFGGAVRDTMISEHFAKKFREHLRANGERYCNKKFWDASYHPESAARTLVPNDIDIYFPSKQKSDDFMQALAQMCAGEHMDMETKKLGIREDPIMSKDYGISLIVQKVSLLFKVGRIPHVFNGYDIVIDIDIVTPRYDIITQPPFMNLDFLCNGFIKTQHGVVYSTYTGTYMDALSDIERTVEVAKIQKDMLNFTTNFCKFEKNRNALTGTFSKNSYAFKRIKKLLEKDPFPWTISNLPFELVNSVVEDAQSDCLVCCMQFHADEKLAIMYTTKQDSITNEVKKIRASASHKDCLMKYLDHQHAEAAKNLMDREVFAFRCPTRTPIDFTRCPCTYKS